MSCFSTEKWYRSYHSLAQWKNFVLNFAFSLLGKKWNWNENLDPREKAHRQRKAADRVAHFSDGNWVLFVWVPLRGFIRPWFRTTQVHGSLHWHKLSWTYLLWWWWSMVNPLRYHLFLFCFTNELGRLDSLWWIPASSSPRHSQRLITRQAWCSPRYLLSRHDSGRHHTKTECRSVSPKNNLVPVSLSFSCDFFYLRSRLLFLLLSAFFSVLFTHSRKCNRTFCATLFVRLNSANTALEQNVVIDNVDVDDKRRNFYTFRVFPRIFHEPQKLFTNWHFFAKKCRQYGSLILTKRFRESN